MIKSVPLFLMLITLACVACEKADDTGRELASAKVVVEGYLYANEPLEHLKISSIDPNGSSSLLPLEGAVVEILSGSEVYQFFQLEDRPQYYMPVDTTWVVADSGEFILSITYKDEVFIGRTVMPQKVTGVQLSDSIVNVVSYNPVAEVATMSWNEISGTKYCIFLREVSPGETINYASGGNEETINPFMNLTNTNSVTLYAENFPTYGVYKMYVTSVNPEYEHFYSEDGPNFNEPPSNIENSWGIFTAFNGEEKVITVQ